MRRYGVKKLNIKVLIVIFLLFIFLFLSAKTEKAVRPVVTIQAEHTAKAYADKIISEAVRDYLEENAYKSCDFAVVLYDERGKAVSVETLTYNINKVQSELTAKVNERFEKSGKVSVKVPVGSLTDSYLLAGKGFYIKLRICPVGSAFVSLKSDFTSAGENQTCHRIYAEINADIVSTSPLYNFNTHTEFEFLIAESVIAGEVPNILN